MTDESIPSLDPDGAHVGGDGLDGDGLAGGVPVGQRHHHVESGEGEHGVEERPVVAHTVLLVTAAAAAPVSDVVIGDE